MKITWMATHNSQIYDVPYLEGQTVDTTGWDWRQKHNAIVNGSIVPKTVKGAYYLDDLADVDTAGESDGDVLTYNGTDWVPEPPAAAGFDSDPIDDPARWTADLGYDYDFDAVSAAPPTGWSWVNQGSSTYDEKLGGANIVVPAGSSDSIRGIVRSLPAGSGWEATLKFDLASLTGNWVAAGMLLRESASGKLRTWAGFRTGTTIALENWNSPTSFNATSAADSAVKPARYLRLTCYVFGSDYSFFYSPDGIAWIPYREHVSLSSFFAPDEAGFFINTTINNKAALSCRWFRVR